VHLSVKFGHLALIFVFMMNITPIIIHMEANMFRKLLFLCIAFLIVGSLFAGEIKTTIEINGVTVNGGLVYVAVYSNENDYKNEIAFTKFILQPENSSIKYSLNLPEGEYVVSVYQDKNGDEELNTGLFGIPSERIGKTNYNLKGAPGGFDKLKAPVNNNSTTLIINMGKVKLF
jgi:uncharacterized protein (DUF2141 family)